MKKTLIVLTLLLLSEISFASLRTFQCRFTDKKGRMVVAILNIDGEDMTKKDFIGLLSFKIDDFSFPSIKATVHDLVVNADGKIASVRAIHQGGEKRAFLGITQGAEISVQFDLTEDLSGGAMLPATCGEL